MPLVHCRRVGRGEGLVEELPGCLWFCSEACLRSPFRRAPRVDSMPYIDLDDLCAGEAFSLGGAAAFMLASRSARLEACFY